MGREEERNEATSWKKSIWLVRYTNPDGSCDPRCCGVCPALPCYRAAAFSPCRLVVGGFAGVGGYARLPGLLDDWPGRNHSTCGSSSHLELSSSSCCCPVRWPATSHSASSKPRTAFSVQAFGSAPSAPASSA